MIELIVVFAPTTRKEPTTSRNAIPLVGKGMIWSVLLTSIQNTKGGSWSKVEKGPKGQEGVRAPKGGGQNKNPHGNPLAKP